MAKIFRSQLPAALCDGAQAPNAVLPQIHLFDDDNFRGDELDIYGGGTDSLSRDCGKGWNDDISSVIVVSGTWELFWDDGCVGNKLILPPGVYPSLAQAGTNPQLAFPAIPEPGWNDQLSSLRPIKW